MDWTEMAWRSVHLPALLFTAKTLPLRSLCPPSPAVQNVTLAVVIGEEKSDLVWQWWGKCQERHPHRCREDTLQKTKRKKRKKKTTTTQKQETIKIPFRHERDSSEQGRWGPWWWAHDSPSVKKTPEGCKVNTEWVSGFLPCHSQIAVPCWSGAGEAEIPMLVIIKVHHVRR